MRKRKSFWSLGCGAGVLCYRKELGAGGEAQDWKRLYPVLVSSPPHPPGLPLWI